MAKNFTLGDRVQYTDGQGFTKLAFITGTRKSIAKGTEVARPEKDQAHLLVISPTGKQYPRESIPFGEGPRTFTTV